MRLIDGDAFDAVLEKAQFECKRNGGNFRFGVINTVRANLKKFPTVGEWISVEDRLPDDARRVLCCTKTQKGVCNIVIGYYMGGMWRCGMNSNVVYWMELPKVPE